MLKYNDFKFVCVGASHELLAEFSLMTHDLYELLSESITEEKAKECINLAVVLAFDQDKIPEIFKRLRR